MDKEDEEVRDVYAYYGLAMYWASCLEQSIFQHLLFFDHFPKAVASYKNPEQWAQKFDEFETKEMKQTMGKLVRRLKDTGQPTDDIELMLDSALKTRNWLAHSYFSDRAIQFTISDDRMNMISELQDIRDQFIQCTKAIDEITEPVMKKYGFTEELREKVMKEMVNDHTNQDKNA